MNTKTIGGLVAALGMAVSVLAGSPAFAKHDSNSLHKLGKAIQYPVRKAGENLSTDVHRGTDHNSIHTNRHTGHKVIVTPAGDKVPLHRHHRYVRRHRHHWHKK